MARYLHLAFDEDWKKADVEPEEVSKNTFNINRANSDLGWIVRSNDLLIFWFQAVRNFWIQWKED